MSYIAGRLNVYLDQAKLDKDVGGLFDKQDPYCELIVGSVVQRSVTRDNQAKTPVWGQNFSFPLTGRDGYFTVICKDENVGTDTIIGTCSVPLTHPPAPGPMWIDLYDGKKRTGSILMTLTYIPANVAVPQGSSSSVTFAPGPTPHYAPPAGAGYPGAAPAPSYPHTQQPNYSNYAPPPQQYPHQYPPHQHPHHPPPHAPPHAQYPPQQYPPQQYPPQQYPPSGPPPPHHHHHHHGPPPPGRPW